MTVSDLDLLYSIGQVESPGMTVTMNPSSVQSSIDTIEKARIKIARNYGIVFANQERARLYRILSRKDTSYKLPLAMALGDLSLSMADRKIWKGSLLAAKEASDIINQAASNNTNLSGNLAAILNNIGIIYREMGDPSKSSQYLERSRSLYAELLRKDQVFRADHQNVLNNIKSKSRP